MVNYDLVVIGSGPGGYVAAIEAAHHGKKVVVIEKGEIGGACLNVGCIPSKAYLKHSHWFLDLLEAKTQGLQFEFIGVDFPKLVARKNQVIKKLQGGISYLFKTNGIDYLHGEAQINHLGEVVVAGEKVSGKNILLATGSRPFVPPIPGIETANYLTTDEFFALAELPKKLVIIGGGVIAVELAFAMQPLGVSVTIIEVAKDILLTEDPEAREIIKKQLEKIGIEIETAAKIDHVTKNTVQLEQNSYTFDQLLVATGRKPNLQLASALNLALDPSDRFVAVDHHYQTSRQNIYAIGDLIGNYQLAHVASTEGICAVNGMFHMPKLPVNGEEVPRCVYTSPEVASFGLNEESAKAQGYAVKTKKIKFAGNGKAIASMETNGFVKIISEKKYQQILGAVIVGAHATEMIHTILAVKVAEGTVDELEKVIFAHPTLSEAIGETAQGIINRPIHE